MTLLAPLVISIAMKLEKLALPLVMLPAGIQGAAPELESKLPVATTIELGVN